MNSSAAPVVAHTHQRVRARDVADLTVTAAYPCISVLMPTDPAPRMTSRDTKRLHGLVDDVAQQLREQGIAARTRLMRELASRVQQVSGRPTDRAVAIYVSLAVSRTFWLSVPVTAHAVVEPVREGVEHYLRSRREEAMDDLRTTLASRPVDVVSGMAACWHAVHQRVPGVLLVEHDLVCPGRPEDDVVPTSEPRPPSAAPAVHDLVDDLIEVVIVRGGQLALVDRGDLAAQGGVALVSRRSGPR